MVSVIIPTYRRSDSLRKAIMSCLHQSVENIEVIVVDDNEPTSEYRAITEKIMEEYKDNPKVIYIKHLKNMKGSAARNTGINFAHGNYITFLDDDDILDDRKLELQVSALEKKNSEYGVVICGVRVCDESNGNLMRTIIPYKEGNVQFDILKLRLGTGTGSNPMFTKEAIEATGLFDTSFLRHQDTEYLIRVLRNYKLAVIKDVLVTKYESGHPNRPGIDQYITLQEHFFNTFKPDIERFSKEQQLEIYRNNWHQMCIVAIDDKKWKNAVQCYKKASKYMRYTIKMRLGIIRHIINNKY